MTKNGKKLLINFGLVLVGGMVSAVLLGFILFPRQELPTIVPEETCEQYNIRFDTSSIDMIYGAPERILAAPEEFLNQDTAYSILAESREQIRSNTKPG